MLCCSFQVFRLLYEVISQVLENEGQKLQSRGVPVDFFCIPFIADTRIHIIKADHDVYYNRRENKNNDQHIESLEQQSYTDTIIK